MMSATPLLAPAAPVRELLPHSYTAGFVGSAHPVIRSFSLRVQINGEEKDVGSEGYVWYTRDGEQM